jgi:hypothetical protein
VAVTALRLVAGARQAPRGGGRAAPTAPPPPPAAGGAAGGGSTGAAAAAHGSSGGGSGGSAASSSAVGGVASLAWVLPGHQVLAVVLAPALLLLWDVASECGCAWRASVERRPRNMTAIIDFPVSCVPARARTHTHTHTHTHHSRQPAVAA